MEEFMSVAKVTEITSASTKSFEDAITNGIKRANDTIDKIQGAWIKEQKVVCSDGKITEYRVTMKVTFVLK
jgi:dodecin